MNSNRDNNGFLYFAVGALLVAVAVIGYLYVDNTGLQQDGPTIIQTETPNTEDTSSNSFEFRVDDDGVSASQTNEE